jgi:hypothetical protein
MSRAGFARKVWSYGWGALFVAVMTILSECGPQVSYSKDLARAPVASLSPGQAIK